jgi:diphosphomevalonate decarboxylase
MRDWGTGWARAHPNIALVKYWGKRDSGLRLPYAGSIGLTLDLPQTETTVCFDHEIEEDSLTLNGEDIAVSSPKFQAYLEPFLAHVRASFGISTRVAIVSRNNFPSSAGLASSSSGFAALAAAIDSALELGLDQRELSILARMGSGSAARSVCGGFVEWQRGLRADGRDSFAEELSHHWPEFRVLLCLSRTTPKDVTSRGAMQQSVSSPLFQGWLDQTLLDLAAMRNAVENRDFPRVGMIAEGNALMLHATILAARAPVLYLASETIELIRSIWRWRAEGISCFFTLDAGPNLKVLALNTEAENLKKLVLESGLASDVLLCGPGPGVTAGSTTPEPTRHS